MKLRLLENHWRPAAAAAAVVAVCVAGAIAYRNSQSGPVSVSVPRSVATDAASQCAKLLGGLPASIDGLKPRTTSPKSTLTAAWGTPAMTLRCGVSAPGKITPGADDYDPLKAEMLSVDNVTWLAEGESGGMRFTTAYRHTFVQVHVPLTGMKAGERLTDLAAPIIASIPDRDGNYVADKD